MSIYTLDEVNEEIAAFKQAITVLATGGEETEIDTGLTKRKVKRASLPTLRDHIIWLQDQKNLIVNPSGTGTVLHGLAVRQ